MKPALFRCLGIAAALLLPLRGNVTVTTTADENNSSLDPGIGAGTSLREAVAYAPAGAVIDFAPTLSGQTITLTTGQIRFGKNLTLDASALAGGVVISGNDTSRVFDIPSSRTVAMTRVKIVHGDTSGDGGGLRNAGSLALTDCELTANHADDGGGAIENSGPLTATACTFAGNTAGVGGGAIEHTANTLTLINCTLTGNTADFGGAIDGDGSSTIQLRSSTLSGNHATNHGGGIEETTGTLVLENTLVAGNTADDEGDDLKASGINTQGGVNLVSSTAGLGGGKTGFGFLPVGLFNMEHWRSHAAHGCHALSVAMIGTAPEIAQVIAWTEGPWRLLRIVLGGADPLTAVTVNGIAADCHTGAWCITFPNGANPNSQVVATWPGGPTLTRTVPLVEPAVAPQLFPEKFPAGLRVGWWSRAGYRYQAEHSDNLIDWTPAGTIHFGTGGWMKADDPGAGPRGFTRLEASRLTD